MRRSILMLSVCLVVGQPTWADEKDDKEKAEKAEKLAAIKKRAVENWKKVDGGDEAVADTEHFVIIAAKTEADKLKEHGELFEKFYEQAFKALYKEKDLPFKTLITVYLLPQPEQIDAFLRRVEKRRPLRQENGSFSATDDAPHVVAVQREKTDPALEQQAAQQVASLLLQRRAGRATILPYWFLNGFGRATWYRVESKSVVIGKERASATRYLLRNRGRNAQQVWSGVLEGEEAMLLEAALADFLAYGPARMKFPSFVEAFRPGENEERRSVEQALQTVELRLDVINKKFREWAVTPD